MGFTLTIGELASYAGVTVRAVRHYHAKGLLPEPARDSSGYRRYDAAAVVDLIRIRTLAESGVPLSRVRDLMDADPDEFASAVAEIEERLQREIEEREELCRRLAKLAAGDSLALPPDAVAYLERMRELQIPERAIEVERDAWILIAAQSPAWISEVMAVKREQIEDPEVVSIYQDLMEASTWPPDDPRLPDLVDRLASDIERSSQEYDGIEDQIGAGMAELIDSFFVGEVPAARRIMELLEQRGWTGWTQMKRVDPPEPCPPEDDT